ncbi:Imm26 family immunity protein [Pseudomonas inefficax]|uniref:Imm26 family immunity protein n=1 Tax=Pseudomonas inefficax TaxID=2078786 RepID=UPI004046EDC0
MSLCEFYGWDKQVKTSLKKIKAGDIFCFALDKHKYGVGRIMVPNSLGHVAEIFDCLVDSPVIDCKAFSRLGDPVILDSYSLFDRKAEGDWRIVAHQNDYQPSDDETVRFVYGVADNVKLVDIFDNEAPFSGEGSEYPLYSPMGDEEVRKHFRL